MKARSTALFTLFALILAAPVARSDEPAEAAFAGQHAASPPEWKFPVWPAACRRLPDPERLACAEFVLDDWPRLSRYAAANAALAAPEKNEQRVVFMGDSITDNWSRSSMGGFFPGRRYINRGIGGQTTPQMLVRFRADVVALGPRAVVILAGINDLGGNSGPTTPEAIENNLASMADLARANGIKVILASILPVSPLFAPKNRDPKEWAQSKNEKIRAINVWIAELCRKQKLVFLDYYAATRDDENNLRHDLTYDGLHPNRAGYTIMGPLAEKAIARALGH